jgi:hypothetical protein
MTIPLNLQIEAESFTVDIVVFIVVFMQWLQSTPTRSSMREEQWILQWFVVLRKNIYKPQWHPSMTEEGNLARINNTEILRVDNSS